MNPFLGYFVIVHLGDGCLGSKYGNTFNTQLLTESATLVSTPINGDLFIGEYVTTWIDTLRPVDFTQARLIISRKAESVSQYTLIWHEEGNPSNIYYYGEGMLYESNLVGSYWNDNIQRAIF